MSNIIANAYERSGQNATNLLFPGDHIHTSPEGAARNAAYVVSGLKETALREMLSATGMATPDYHPGPELPTPRYPMPLPLNSTLPTIFLIGDSTVRNGRADGANG